MRRRRIQRKKMRKLAEKDDIWSAEEKTNGKEKEENQTQKENVLSDRQTDTHTEL